MHGLCCYVAQVLGLSLALLGDAVGLVFPKVSGVCHSRECCMVEDFAASKDSLQVSLLQVQVPMAAKAAGACMCNCTVVLL